MNYLRSIGRYAIMIKEVFKKPTKWRIMKSLILKEVDELIFGSLGILIFISFFMLDDAMLVIKPAIGDEWNGILQPHCINVEYQHI